MRSVVHLSSIGCDLVLQGVYDKVEFPNTEAERQVAVTPSNERATLDPGHVAILDNLRDFILAGASECQAFGGGS